MSNRKKIFLLMLLIVSILVVGCTKNQKVEEEVVDKIEEDVVEREENKDEYHTIVDMAGNEVELKKDIESIAITPIPWASLVFAVDDSAERVVATNPSAMNAYEISFLPELSPEFADINTDIIGKDFKINMEEMAKLDPDLVIVWDYQTDEIEKLSELGIPAVAIKYGTLESLQDGIKLIGKILNKEDKAQKLVDYHIEVTEYLDTKKDDINIGKRPNALYFRNKSLAVFGETSVNQIFFKKSGGRNLAEETENNIDLTMEQVIDWDPELVYLSNFDDFLPEDIYNNSFDGQVWDEVSASKNKRVYKTPIGIYRWDAPAAETPLMMMWMAKVQQPEVFSDLDLDEEIKEFYEEFFNYELKQEQIDTILNKEINKDIETGRK